jgi:hypothetical protein
MGGPFKPGNGLAFFAATVDADSRIIATTRALKDVA